MAGKARITIISEPDQGGYNDAQALGAQHQSIPGLASGLSLRRTFRACRDLILFLKTRPADLVWVHARLPVLLCRVAMMVRLWRPAHPVLFTFHGLPFGKGHRSVLGCLSGMVEHCILRFAPPLDLVFLSGEMKTRLITQVGAHIATRHRLHILPNCSDLDQQPPIGRKAGCNIVMTGRACFQKDYATAVRVFASLPDRFTLTLAGSGTQVVGFQKRIARLVPHSTFNRITFCGPVQEVGPLLLAADLFVMTSRYEGLPIGALEAFEAGLPLILKDFDGARELAASHPFALVAAFHDLASDQGQILALLADYQRQLPRSRKAIKRAWAQSFSPEVFQRGVDQLLEDCGLPLIHSAAVPDYAHDGPAQHQYHDKTSGRPAPALPPCYTDGAPSVRSE